MSSLLTAFILAPVRRFTTPQQAQPHPAPNHAHAQSHANPKPPPDTAIIPPGSPARDRAQSSFDRFVPLLPVESTPTTTAMPLSSSPPADPSDPSDPAPIAMRLALADAPPQSSLPADDGMRGLRKRIHEIRDMRASAPEKAQAMHALMTQSWQAARGAGSIGGEGGHVCHAGHGGHVRSGGDPEWNVRPQDLRRVYRPRVEGEEEEELVLGCRHYKRNVKVQCYDCRAWYPCRHCHDEGEGHALNRRATENMLCMLCLTPQPAGQYCRSCGGRAGWYYCDICKLWDDDGTKRIYHCGDCGICRRGEGLGKDFQHCKKCNVCISIQNFATHRCIERATECDCPICGEYMFTSALDIVAMPCGHYLHAACYTAYMATAYKCPICKASAANMELAWRKLDSEIARQPMPRQWADTRADVRCNDCGHASVVPYHWLGCKCAVCDGFNTLEVRLLAAERVVRDVEDFARRERLAAERREGQRGEGVRSTVLAARPAGGYFQTAEEERGRAGNEQGLLEGFRPMEMMARFGARSLSPIRHYFEEEEEVGSEDDDEEEGGGGIWGEEGWFFSEESEGEGTDEEVDVFGGEEGESEDEDGDGGGRLDLQLIGHR
ncbi:zf-CHY-domain-containing protein [Trichodelitschia bisporula]|uniref:Zf-CHY-domain-containing protein n=1 Tax=Trichodelitschia bisporula TaxID=703511 RepID=A0A6G1HT19_9PEZI|nr:zf-CHY-domain-containing protein [Trichodelitschia bisporula]